MVHRGVNHLIDGVQQAGDVLFERKQTHHVLQPQCTVTSNLRVGGPHYAEAPPHSFTQSWRQNGGFRERIRSIRANGREFRAQSDCEPLGSSAGYGTFQCNLIWVREEFKNQISTFLGERHLVMLNTPDLRGKTRNVILSIHWTGLCPHPFLCRSHPHGHCGWISE